MTDMTMGQRIGSERKKLGLSQEALGEKVGVSRQAISKWEADGAVPEIDKLITLSKLFGVSVGWLLGVEEMAPEAEEAGDLSEKQLELIEQIMKKYQPRPVVSKFRLALTAGIAALGLTAITIMTLASMGIFDQPKANTHAIDALRQEMNMQLAELDSRISSLNAVQTQTPAPALLADYKLEIAGIVSGDQPAAEISFSAVPNTWQAGDSAALSIRRDGAATVSQPCTWDGAFLTARTFLEVADGYELCFTLTHSDGTQEQQVLSDAYIQNLKKTFSITVEATPAQWSYENKVLTLKNYEFKVSMPMGGIFYGSLAWEQVDLVLTTGSGEELGRFSLLSAQDEQDSDVLASPDVWMEHTKISFVDLELPKNEGILLWLSAETNNGLTAMEPVSAWATDETGKLRSQ